MIKFLQSFSDSDSRRRTSLLMTFYKRKAERTYLLRGVPFVEKEILLFDKIPFLFCAGQYKQNALHNVDCKCN